MKRSWDNITRLLVDFAMFFAFLPITYGLMNNWDYSMMFTWTYLVIGIIFGVINHIILEVLRRRI